MKVPASLRWERHFRIRFMRARGWTYEAIGKVLGISHIQVKHYEKWSGVGPIKPPSGARAAEQAKAREATRPPCACGCGKPTPWHASGGPRARFASKTCRKRVARRKARAA